MICNNVNDSIEAAKTQLIGLKIGPKGPPKIINGFDGVLFPFEVKRRGKGKILTELNPKEPIIFLTSMLNVDDEINGRWLLGFSQDCIRPDNIIVGGGGRTSRHSGQEIIIRNFCFTCIAETWTRQTPNALPTDTITEVISS